MTNNNINLNEETTVKKKKNKKRSMSKAAIYEIAEYIFAFFMNKINIFAAISPFGISYFAATFPMQEMSLGTIAAFLGIIFMGFGVSSLKYIGALSLYLLFMILYNKDISDKQWISALCASISLFAVGMVFVIANGFLLYDTMLLMLEAIFAFLSFFPFQKAAVLLRTIKNRKSLELSEVLSLIFLFSVLLLSISSIPNFEAAGHAASIAVILAVSLSSGFQLSCAAGVILGTVLSYSSVLSAQVISAYTISALCAGLLRRFGKIGVSLGFIFANALVTLYLNSSSLTIIDILCTLSAVLIIMLIPKKFFVRLGEITQAPVIPSANDKGERALEMITEKLSGASDSFCELAELFSVMTEESTKTNELAAGAIFDSVFYDVCSSCNLCTYCWHKNYDKTTSYLAEMFTSMSSRGTAIEFDAPCDFRSECIHFDDFLESVNKNYEIHKINLSWASKVCESKSLLAEQFKNLSCVLNNMKTRLEDGFECDSALEKKIETELDKKGISAFGVKVNLTDCFEVSMTVPLGTDKTTCKGLIAATVGTAIGTPVFPAIRRLNDDGCFLKFCEKANYSVEVGFAKTSPEGASESGDSLMYLPLENGKYVLSLSDGMGHGKDAAIESKLTTQLIKKLLTLGFDKETALKIINTFLLFKSHKETYATADVCIINLYSGALEFIKSGAVSSYIKHNEEITQIKCTSLPAGAVSALNADCELKYAEDGDYIIMVTDGISDILETEKENLLTGIIEAFSGGSPQDLADEIIKSAMSRISDSVYDDMTVLVSKITEEM